MGLLVFLISTAVFLVISITMINVIEANVHNYWLRFITMIVVGTGIGALGAAFGYQYFILAILLFFYIGRLRKQLKEMAPIDDRTAKKYTLPALMLIICATAGSHIFASEVVYRDGSSAPVFFKRLYIPPHLISPD
jgi:hypothetical protein